MSELWASKEIRKEELRGIFVIGAIATLLALRGTTMAQQTANFPTLFGTLLQLAGVKLPETGITWVVVIDNTIAYWLLYVVITCVALIDDFFPRNRAVRGTAYFSKLLSRLLYISAVIVTAMWGVLVLWVTISFSVLLLLIVIVPIYLYTRIFAKKGSRKIESGKCHS